MIPSMSKIEEGQLPYLVEGVGQETVPNRVVEEQIRVAQQLLWNSQDEETKAMYLLYAQFSDEKLQLPTLTPEVLTKLEKIFYVGRDFLRYSLAAKKIVMALQSYPAGMLSKTLDQFLRLQKSHVDNLAELLTALDSLGVITKIKSSDGKQRFVLEQPTR